MMNLILTMVVVMVVGTVVGLILANCNCELIVNNTVVVKAFFPWTFNKKVKEYKEAQEAQKRAERQAYEEAKAIKQQRNRAKKLSALRIIELGKDVEQNVIIKRYNDIMLDYAENWHNVDVQHFEWLQYNLNNACYEALNKLMLARQNHNKIMEFHCC